MKAESSETAEAVKILIIDDHEIVRAGLRLLIERTPRYSVVGEAKNMAEAVFLASREQPHIILLDIAMGDENGLNYIPKLVGACENARILILTGVTDPQLHQRALQLGAMGIFSKEKAPEILAKAIEKVHAGEAWLDRVTMAHVLTEFSRPAKSNPFTEAAKIESITSREREVIHLVMQGLKNKQIAERLSISEITVRHHLTSIFSKLDVQDRFELIIFAFKHGLSESP